MRICGELESAKEVEKNNKTMPSGIPSCALKTTLLIFLYIVDQVPTDMWGDVFHNNVSRDADNVKDTLEKDHWWLLLGSGHLMYHGCGRRR
jgi:hypothetical protein